MSRFILPASMLGSEAGDGVGHGRLGVVVREDAGEDVQIDVNPRLVEHATLDVVVAGRLARGEELLPDVEIAVHADADVVERAGFGFLGDEGEPSFGPLGLGSGLVGVSLGRREGGEGGVGDGLPDEGDVDAGDGVGGGVGHGEFARVVVAGGRVRHGRG